MPGPGQGRMGRWGRERERRAGWEGRRGRGERGVVENGHDSAGRGGGGLVGAEVQDLQLLHVSQLVGKLRDVVLSEVQLAKLPQLLCRRRQVVDGVSLQVQHLQPPAGTVGQASERGQQLGGGGGGEGCFSGPVAGDAWRCGLVRPSGSWGERQRGWLCVAKHTQQQRWLWLPQHGPCPENGQDLPRRCAGRRAGCCVDACMRRPCFRAKMNSLGAVMGEWKVWAVCRALYPTCTHAWQRGGSPGLMDVLRQSLQIVEAYVKGVDGGQPRKDSRRDRLQ